MQVFKKENYRVVNIKLHTNLGSQKRLSLQNHLQSYEDIDFWSLSLSFIIPWACVNICIWNQFLVDSQCSNLSLRTDEVRDTDAVSAALQKLECNTNLQSDIILRLVFVDPFSMILCSCMSLNPVFGTGYYNDPRTAAFTYLSSTLSNVPVFSSISLTSVILSFCLSFSLIPKYWICIYSFITMSLSNSPARH